MPKKFIIFVVILCITIPTIKSQTAQDTTHFTLQEAEKIFLQKNLFLIASKYNIDANKALIEQAKLWDNPILTTDQNIYDGKKGEGKFFRHDANNGQFFIQLTQLIKTADKRNKLAQLATDNTLLAQEQYNDAMRSLRYILRSDLLEINHQLKIKKIFDAEIIELKHLIAGMDEELKAGNIALKDNMRLKALLFNLQNELANITNAILPVQSELKLLMQATDNNFIALTTEYQFGELTTDSIPSLDSLVNVAIKNRPDSKIAQTAMEYQNHNLIYQKSLAKADVTIGSEYDQRSSYNPNYIGFSVALPLNIFNKNQGNIKSAQYNIKQQQILTEYQYSKIKNEVNASIIKLKYLQNLNNLQQLDFSTKYDNLFQNILKSYLARQINLLEFLDFIDAYKDTKLKLVEQHNNLLKAIEEINYTTNSKVINIK